MFEKSLVDLIKGLRSHKGNEAAYIQNAIKECRAEIRSQDMDVKATALLKLIYLEMFGYDMSWASFNVLEVMSSSKYLQKRVGYLAAVQTFRPDTEVLMLATNLLKKDITSPSIPVLSLPLTTLPHIITSSIALSVLGDVVPRLSHSQPAIRKKSIVTLYRLALVYPETIRVAWPKIKERLLDEQEDSSVTAATVNVVCELGWRRPQDFLPLAPRLFELLTEGRNNWMAIKIIKLFAVLTPLEPRLVKKLVRPLTNLIETTQAMSLLYECISGIIHGGILEGDSGSEGDEVASVCIRKLQGMITLEGDPNLKYVALLAFNKIVSSYPLLVSAQQDVILGCLDDPDVSIRLQALDLVSGMVNSDSLQSIVNRLLKQLSSSPIAPVDTDDEKPQPPAIEIAAEPDEADMEQKLTPTKRSSEMEPLPDEYRRQVINSILDVSSHDNYANVLDFEWYTDVLMRLCRWLPPKIATAYDHAPKADMARRIGVQLLDIAVRVKDLRRETTQTAEKLILVNNRSLMFPATDSGEDEVLQSVAWLVGEYAEQLNSPHEVLNSVIHESALKLAAPTLSAYVQAAPKIFARIATISSRRWDVSQKTLLSLLLARMINFMEKLATHPSLEVQERSVEFLELLRLASEALSSPVTDVLEAPLLLTVAIPNLFSGMELNPVAAGAQKKVPLPDDLDLDTPINPDLPNILQMSQIADAEDSERDDSWKFYHEKPAVPQASQTPAKVPEVYETEPDSYQALDDPETRELRRAERRARNKDDPFYIPHDNDQSGRSTPFHDVLSKSNGDELDIDSIPIIDLKINHAESTASAMLDELQKQKKKRKPVRRVAVAADETIESENVSSSTSPRSRSLEPGNGFPTAKPVRPKSNLLSVDSRDLQNFSLEDNGNGDQLDIERREAEDAEMAAAMKEVERLRREMQRAAERAEMAEGVDAEGTVVKKKKKKRRPNPDADSMGAGLDVSQPPEGEEVVQKKKKKKKTKLAAEVDVVAEE